MADIAIATVVAVTGTAYARSASGELREIKPGDELLEGETVVTPNAGSVELSLADGNPFLVSDVPEMTLTRDIVAERAAGPEESAVEDETVAALLAALEGDGDIGDVLDAPAAGAQGGDGGEGSSFVRLGRVVEETGEFNTLTRGVTTDDVVQAGDNDIILPVDAIEDAVTIEADQTTVINVLANDIFIDGATITSVGSPANGTVTVNADNTVTYTPNQGFSGQDFFSYTATSLDGNNQDGAIVTVTVEGVAVAPIVISASAEDVAEGGVAEVVLTLSAASATPITVDFQTADGTATVVDDDFNPVAGTITFAPGQTTASIFVQTTEDDVLEGTEQFSVKLSNPVGAGLQAEQVDISIIDNFIPTVSINDATVSEGGVAELTLSLSAAVNSPVTVQFGSFDGTATVVGGDYDATTGTVAFGPGQTTATILIQTNTDTLVEGTEQFTIDLLGATGATIANGQGTVTLFDATVADAPVGADVQVGAGGGARVSEAGLPDGSAPASGSATTEGVVTIIAPDIPVTITIEGEPVTVVGQEFTGAFGTLTVTGINADSIGYTYTLVQNTSGNTTADRFEVTVTDVDGDSVSGNLVINITDDQPRAVNDTVIIAPGSYAPIAGDVLANDIQGADGAAVSGVAQGNISAPLVDGATVGTAIQGTYGVLTIEAGGSYSYQRGPGTPDGVNDVFTYTLRDGDGDTSTATLVVSLDRETIELPPPPLSIGDATVVEGGTAIVTVTLSAATGQPVTVDFASSDGTAVSGADYNPASGTLTFAAGQTTATLEVVTLDDTQVEGDETLTVSLSNPSSNATIANGQGTVTITDPLMASNQSVTVNEAALDTSIEGDDLASGTVTGSVGTASAAETAGSTVSTTGGTSPVSYALQLGGNAVTAGQYGAIQLNTDGTFVYTLTAPVNGITGNDGVNTVPGAESFTYVATDDNGNTATGTIAINVIDDVPVAGAATQVLAVPISATAVDELAAGWANLTSTSGNGSVIESADADGIYLQWGGSNGSGYDFVLAAELATGSEVATDARFSLGTLTHNNFPISNSAAVLATADMEVSFTLLIDGVATAVTTTIGLTHTETPNSGDRSNPENDDIIEISNPDQTTTITVGDREFLLTVRGFLDSEGNLVTSARTTENESTSFQLVAEISSTDDLPQVSGVVAPELGADGAAAGALVAWESGTDTVSSGVIEGSFGSLSVAADGSYTYNMSRIGRASIEENTTAAEGFTYFTTDGDGDTVTSTLALSLQGVANTGDGSPIPLLATSGDDIFAFALNDEGAAHSDVTISGFGGSGDDVLDLRDLLLGEEAEGADLTNYLSISSGGTDTVIEVSVSGGFNAGALADQTITLESIDLVGANDLATVIQGMLDSGKLSVDQ